MTITPEWLESMRAEQERAVNAAVGPDAHTPGLMQKLLRESRTMKPLPKIGEVTKAKPERGAFASFADDPFADADALFSDLEAFLARFIVYPSEDARVAHVLWIAHTHLMPEWESTPRIAFLSPERESGKTRAIEISELLTPRPVEAINVSPAYLFRKLSDPDGLPTILFDEIDTMFGAKAKEHEELRGVLNAGHRRGAVAGRCVVIGKTVTTEELPAYCAVALAGIGNLPDTILSRSIIIRMRRRAPSERVDPFRRRIHSAEGHALRDELASWAQLTSQSKSLKYPDMPEGVEDRAADVWEPLLAIADVVGGDWPRRARAAAVTFVTDFRAGSPSLGILLLSHLRTIFGSRDAIATNEILSLLHDMDDAPWSELKGKALNALGLSRLLGGYGIKRTTIRISTGTAKGYRREDMFDAWQRYLPEVDPIPTETVTTVTGVTSADSIDVPHVPIAPEGDEINDAEVF